jgi:hypothetical protein
MNALCRIKVDPASDNDAFDRFSSGFVFFGGGGFAFKNEFLLE